jgi:hypothetical protein
VSAKQQELLQTERCLCAGRQAQLYERVNAAISVPVAGATLSPRTTSLLERGLPMRRMSAMCCRGSFLIASFWVCVTGCGRTSLDAPVTSAGGTVSLGGGVTNTGGAQAMGGVTSTGGAPATGGLINAGGTPATGGLRSTGGSTSASDGSASSNGLDTCSSDADCDYCKWETAPTSSDQCTLLYCCGGIISTKKRCEANQAAWNSYCPNQSPKDIICPCPYFCPITCVGGECDHRCPTPP